MSTATKPAVRIPGCVPYSYDFDPPEDMAQAVMFGWEIEKHRDDWLAARRFGIGGSDAAAVMGVGRGGRNALSVWLDKVGRLPDQETNDAMDWGTRAEDAGARWWADRNGIGIEPAALYRSMHWPHVTATPDRMCDCGGTLEVKVQSQWMAPSYGTDDAPVIPLYYWWQLVMQMAVTGYGHAHLTAVCGQRPIDRVLSRDDPAVGGDEGIAEKMEYLEWWWATYVETGVAPVNDPTVLADLDTIGAVDRIQAAIPAMTLTDRMRDEEISDEIDALQLEQKEIRARAMAEIGSGRVLMVDDYAAFIKVRRQGSRTVKVADIENHPSLQPWQKKALIKTGQPSSHIRRAGQRK